MIKELGKIVVLGVIAFVSNIRLLARTGGIGYLKYSSYI
jgi:hypothetical protein